MKDGFLKVTAAKVDIRVGDVGYNSKNIIDAILAAEKAGSKLAVLPELCVVGKTAGDLFFQKTILDAAKDAVLKIAKQVGDIIAVVGFPFEQNGRLYNAAAVLWQKRVLAIVPKTDVLAESRWFSTTDTATMAELGEFKVPFGKNIIIRDENMPYLALAVEIGSDSDLPIPPSVYHTAMGASIIARPSAEIQLAKNTDFTAELSKRLQCVYVTANAGFGESTTDYVLGGANTIYESGTLLAKGEDFINDAVYSEPDLQKIMQNRIKNKAYDISKGEYVIVKVSLENVKTELTRKLSAYPFLPEKSELDARCERILEIQATALHKRLLHTGASGVTLGISGGLDSTLALLVAARAFDKAKLDRKGITAVTMPCFGTTGRTYNNAVSMTREIGATLRVVDIKRAVEQHFADIGHSGTVYDVTYENAQARERTQVLMDIANSDGSLVIGTGDLSELALGWATYNGDHMSMYAVNCSLPKTLIRYIVGYEAQRLGESALSKILFDILDTPVSPELLPPKDGEIAQCTENIVGPYALHDFFLYHMVKHGFSPAKIYRLACYAFEGEYDGSVILEWLKVFSRRFFAQQFKRSCVPDGVKVGSVGLSPRGDLSMPSDSSWALWQKELEELEKR